ncbi:MAG: hypothetical protein Q4D44_04665 [Eubacteriales bacterium]|nr:hypothetical protein [Eubacteriales bacterium]
MSIFDIFQNKSFTQIKIGDWVTQYSAGYWKVINIFPKYAEEDYSYDGKSWKKGDRLGEWVILKKGFTPKMKPSNACDFVDAKWCKLVSNDILHSIEETFAENLKVKEKFEKAPNMPRPSIASVWMALADEQAESFSELIKNLPTRFTLEQFWAWSADYRQHIVEPSDATHILYLYSYLWEIDDNFEPLHFGPELKKL